MHSIASNGALASIVNSCSSAQRHATAMYARRCCVDEQRCRRNRETVSRWEATSASEAEGSSWKGGRSFMVSGAGAGESPQLMRTRHAWVLSLMLLVVAAAAGEAAFTAVWNGMVVWCASSHHDRITHAASSGGGGTLHMGDSRTYNNSNANGMYKHLVYAASRRTYKAGQLAR